MKEIEVFVSDNGKIPLQEWLNSFNDKSIKNRVIERIKRIEHGNSGDCKYLQDEISEFRLAFGAGYRIYYSEHNNIILLLLCGGDKSSQTKDIKQAKKYLEIYKERNNE